MLNIYLKRREALRQPQLVVMAAGIGSRFGGLKQLCPVGNDNEPILMFSLYDAIRAGFKKVIFIIKKEIEADFKEIVKNAKDKIEIVYAFQETNDIPVGFSVPEGRKKPWGTGHAILCASKYIDGPFAVINADDFYGQGAFSMMYEQLNAQINDKAANFSMIGYKIDNTLTEHGHVARGVCTEENGFLKTIDERLKIERHGDKIEFFENEKWHLIPSGSLVSMNFWGFTDYILDVLKDDFPGFLEKAISENPEKGEFLLPVVVGKLLKEGKATVKILKSNDQWFGVTYKDDLDFVVSSIRNLQDKGLYPSILFP